MPPRTRKKAAAKPARTPWQFAEGKYLATPSINRNSVSAGSSVLALREALGLGVGVYDGVVRERVMAEQEAAGLPITGVVTGDDWDVIVNKAKPKKAEGDDA